MSNLTKRVAAGLIGAPLLLLLFGAGGYVLLAFTILLSTLALYEYYGMFMQSGYSPRRIPMIVFSALLILAFYFLETVFTTIALYFSFIYSSLAELARKEKRDPLNVAIDVFGLVYVGIPLSMANVLAGNESLNVMVYILILIWSCDTFAYFGGRMIGRRKLSDISPNKTVEGSVTGTVMTIALSLTAHFVFPEKIQLADSIVLGASAALLSQTGDLFESLLKRYCGVKDSSLIIPGHGGVLDRFDSLLFVVPFAYIYYSYIRGFIC
ncbi:MAG: phosphatidate cytidylyltransferase [Ignavibacteria bacterium]|nr:phosphatidate cytidylyltransferase [Ignavibacteria bacterium]